MISSNPLQKVLLSEDMISRYGPNRTGTLVFTNGCFDLLHPGHVSCLYQAAQYGDQLVVAINSDYSIRLLGKGDNRPLISESDRAIVLAALEFVDAVCLFDEVTPIELIKKLEPDVLVKGADYHPDEVVGQRGGSVVLVPLLEGYSTTDLIARMRSH